MWIVTNKSFLSAVQDSNDHTKFVVRARIKGDLEAFFSGISVNVIESDDSDYRFRVFVSKDVFKTHMIKNINSIDYSNFKDSVKDPERKGWYTKLWAVMFNVQEMTYGVQKWWLNYYDKKIQKPSRGYKKGKV